MSDEDPRAVRPPSHAPAGPGILPKPSSQESPDKVEPLIGLVMMGVGAAGIGAGLLAAVIVHPVLLPALAGPGTVLTLLGRHVWRTAARRPSPRLSQVAVGAGALFTILALTAYVLDLPPDAPATATSSPQVAPTPPTVETPPTRALRAKSIARRTRLIVTSPALRHPPSWEVLEPVSVLVEPSTGSVTAYKRLLVRSKEPSALAQEIRLRYADEHRGSAVTSTRGPSTDQVWVSWLSSRAPIASVTFSVTREGYLYPEESRRAVVAITITLPGW